MKKVLKLAGFIFLILGLTATASANHPGEGVFCGDVLGEDGEQQTCPMDEGRVVDGHGLPVPDLKVVIAQTGAHTYTTYTDDQGRYSFPAGESFFDSDKEVELSFTFTGRPDARDSMRFYVADAQFTGKNIPAEVSTDKNIKIDEIPETFDFVKHKDLLVRADTHNKDVLDDIARTHYYTAKAVSFAEDVLGLSINSTNALGVFTFFDGDTLYLDSGNAVVLGENLGDSEITSKSRPDIDWHEIGHAVMAQSSIGSVGAQPDYRHGGVEWSHLGLANPSTNKSWIEGFATWISAVMKNEMAVESTTPENEPWLFWYGDTSLPTSINLESNHAVWDNLGRHEEFAVAGLLWDFYDSSSMYGGADDDPIGSNNDIKTLWNILNKENLRDMKDVYDALRAEFNPRDVDEIFEMHGFFADNNGNRVRDGFGEETGRAANGAGFVTSFDLNGDGRLKYFNTTKAPRKAYDVNGDDAGEWMSFNLGTRTNTTVSDLSGNGKGDITEAGFYVLPMEGRRKVPVYPEQMVHINLGDQEGNAVSEALVTFAYTYDEKDGWKDYSYSMWVENGSDVAVWIDPDATLELTAKAADIESEPYILTGEEFRANLVPGGDQGSINFALLTPEERVSKSVTQETQKPSGDDEEPGKLFVWILIFTIAAIVGHQWYDKQG